MGSRRGKRWIYGFTLTKGEWFKVPKKKKKKEKKRSSPRGGDKRLGAGKKV